MLVHHLNCGSFCPFMGEDAVCHCLLIEADEGLVLVDTGFGDRACRAPERLHWMHRALLGPRLRPAESSLRRVRALGFDPREVRHIVLTHLDLDHGGGILDFPEAKLHVLRAERDAAVAQATQQDRDRYFPALWGPDPNWEVYEPEGERWFGFEAVRSLAGLPDEILLVPLAGHSNGHTGVAVRTGGRWLLHAGDAYLDPIQLGPPARVPWTVKASAWFTCTDDRARRENVARLGALREQHGAEVEVFCAHSKEEFDRRSRCGVGTSPTPQPPRRQHSSVSSGR